MNSKRAAVAVVSIIALAVIILFLNHRSASIRTVGVIQPMAHIAVSDVTAGLTDVLAKNAEYRVVVKNANGDMTTIPQILARFRDEGVQVYVPIFTTTAQSVKSTITDKPIIFAAVTDPVAANLLNDPTAPSGNVTGVSDLWPIDAQFHLIKQIIPSIKTIGIIHDPNDPSASVTLPLIRSAAAREGIALDIRPVSTPKEVADVLPLLKGNVDALFTANDTTVTKALPALVAFGIQHHIPLFAGDYSSVERGALAAVGQSYYQVGKDAGKMILELASGIPISQIPVRYTEGGDIYLNADAAARMGVEIPASVEKEAKHVYRSISNN